MTISHIAEILDFTGLTDVAYRRTDLEGGLGEIWDITLPDEQTTIRVCDDDGQIHVIVLVGRGQLIDGEQKFSHRLAAPAFVAAALEAIVADYTPRDEVL
jgi:protein tyrosine/serine phosphatase